MSRNPRVLRNDRSLVNHSSVLAAGSDADQMGLFVGGSEHREIVAATFLSPSRAHLRTATATATATGDRTTSA